jgi:hypothetical protein
VPEGQFAHVVAPFLYSLAEQRICVWELAPRLAHEVDPQEFPPLQPLDRERDCMAGAVAVDHVVQAFQFPYAAYVGVVPQLACCDDGPSQLSTPHEFWALLHARVRVFLPPAHA